jgi:hypothetical protein
MDQSVIPVSNIGLLALAGVVFLFLVAICEFGFRFGRRQAHRKPGGDAKVSATATLASGMAILLAFVLGLTINFAQNRYEARRDLVAVEANAIGTAYLRARLVGGEDGDAMAAQIADYARTRLEFTRTGSERTAAVLIARSGRQQDQIWALATRIARGTPTPISASLVAALNDMIDSSLSQRFAFEGRVPQDMLYMLLAFSVIAIGAMGFQLGLTGVREPLLSTLLVVMWTGGMAMTLDLNRPRQGDIRVDAAPLEWTIKGFGPSMPLAPGLPSPKP